MPGPFSEVCELCSQYSNGEDAGSIIDNPEHKSSEVHRFNFNLWQYNKYRKALAKDRNGVVVQITLMHLNGMVLDTAYDTGYGKLTVRIKPRQLTLHNELVFKCAVINETKENNILIINADTLHPQYLFMDEKNNFVSGREPYLELVPKAKYDAFRIKFTCTEIVHGSFKIPVSFTFQTKNTSGKIAKRDQSFSICRSVVIKVENDEITVSGKKKSPYTGEPWKQDIKHFVSASRRKHYQDNYPIPKELYLYLRGGLREWQTYNYNQLMSLREIQNKLQPGHVTKENYQYFFQVMLWLCQIAEELMLEQYNMSQVTMSVLAGGMLELEVPGLAEKRPSIVPGDMIHMRISGDHTAYEGCIRYVTNETVQIEHVDSIFVEMLKQKPATIVDVAFVLGRLPLERQHQGVVQTVINGTVNNLFPSDSLAKRTVNHMYILKDQDFKNPSVCSNKEQRTAVENILNCTSMKAPYIVFGPPGTGKTVTIVESILQIKERTNKRILVCAPANAACDHLTSKLMKHCRPDELLREHSDTRDKSTIPPSILKYSNISDNIVLKTDAAKLLRYRIVVTTLILSGRYTRCNYRPDFVFIDEAAQATETEADVAIGLLQSGGSLILAGDPEQLGPIVHSRIARKYEMETSLLKRLMKTSNLYNVEVEQPNTNFISMLKLNFRSHPDILELPNKLFYGGYLKAVSETALYDPISSMAIYTKILEYNPIGKQQKGVNKRGYPIEFCSVMAKEKREGKSPSYFNDAECRTVINYVKTLVNLNMESYYKVKPSDIGIITPYIRQVYRIKNLLSRNNIPNPEEIEIGTTETFQGREKRIIIISTVRAQNHLLHHDRKYNLGFVRHPQRFNVAITRAISKLIIIGNRPVLETSHLWRDLIDKCMENGSVFGAEFKRRDHKLRCDINRRMGGIVQPANNVNGNV